MREVTSKCVEMCEVASKCVTKVSSCQNAWELIQHIGDEDLAEYAHSRNHEEHEDDELCECEACEMDREVCFDPASCFRTASNLWEIIATSRWNPEELDPEVHKYTVKDCLDVDLDENEDGPSRIISKSLLSENKACQEIRVFGRKMPKNTLTRAELESKLEDVDCAYRTSSERTYLDEDTAIIGARCFTTEANEKKRLGAVVFPDRLDDNECFSLEEDLEIGEMMTHKENDAMLPLIIASIKAIRATPSHVSLMIKTRNARLVDRLTALKFMHEDQDYIHSKSTNVWKALTAEVNKRDAPMFIQITMKADDTVKQYLEEAEDMDDERAEDLLELNTLRGWYVEGMRLENATQKSLYKWIMRNRPHKDQTATKTNLDIACHAAYANNKIYPPDHAIWKTTWSQDLHRKDQEFLW